MTNDWFHSENPCVSNTIASCATAIPTVPALRPYSRQYRLQRFQDLFAARSLSGPRNSRSFSEEGSSVTKSSRIAIKTKESIRFIDPADIVFVKAQGNYILLQRL